MPGAAHLVHMGSHILIQTGNYDEAADFNLDAAAVDELYMGMPDQEGRYPVRSYQHNVHFAWSAAQFEGRSAVALQQAHKLRDKVRVQTGPNQIAQSSYSQLFLSIPLFAKARFGRWDDILSEPEPRAEYLFETAVWHYVRGLARSATGDRAAAEDHRRQVAAIAADEKLPGMGRVSARDMLRLAAVALEADIVSRHEDPGKAIPLFEEAINLQDGLAYTEPPPWYMPMRQALGAALLEADQPDHAEVAFREDLRDWPENGWSPLRPPAVAPRPGQDRRGQAHRTPLPSAPGAAPTSSSPPPASDRIPRRHPGAGRRGEVRAQPAAFDV